MPIDFPSSPAINATYAYGGKTYRYGGVYWSAFNLADQTPTSGSATGFMTAVLLDDYREVLVEAAANAVKNMNSVELNYI
jgi:hypothetical protein